MACKQYRWNAALDSEVATLYATLGQKAAGEVFQRAHPDFTYAAVKGRVQSLRGDPTKESLFSPVAFEHVKGVEFPDKPPRIPDPCIITSDLHFPAFSARWMNRMVRVAMTLGIKNLVMAGDVFNFDAISVFLRLFHTSTVSEEIEEGGKAIDMLLRWFGWILWLKGNHEQRMDRLLNGQIDTDQWTRMVVDDPRVHVTPWSWAETEDRKWQVLHPGSHSINPLTVAREQALLDRQNIISAHGHKLGQTWDKGAHQVCIDSGGLFDNNLLEYVVRVKKSKFRAQNGFVVYRGGVCTVYGEWPWSDWREIDN